MKAITTPNGIDKIKTRKNTSNVIKAPFIKLGNISIKYSMYSPPYIFIPYTRQSCSWLFLNFNLNYNIILQKKKPLNN